MPEPHDVTRVDRRRSLGGRWLGVGLASVISVVTLVLGLTGRLTLYISPESVWFACAAAVVTLAGAIWSFTLPLGAEADHGHDHDAMDAHDHDHAGGAARRALGATATVAGGVIATGIVAGALLLPPASLSVELAMSRDPGADVLFAGSDVVALGTATDTSGFGIGDWSSVFATSPRPETYDGAEVELTGFLTPAETDDEVRLTRMVITHCVIDAQPAAVPLVIEKWQSDYAVGDWLQITGVVRVDDAGALHVEPTQVTRIDEPGDPYEH
ncbi:hypothetical protein GCM10025768_03200 [Microbacterium pseudoresistens]|uniref:Putative repeat protein (TIGR03943 family) n=1 Tax=Microbacterium pseudoresistens TaxID=640634 RepID=A0A7Y9JML7_9MICO|nr:TIGR03943 family protein [Microbacterium pseudoresistens]NYD54156.1 putative repeat protein (TIGR03943 family) [Microbacterium pseudoresistens]